MRALFFGAMVLTTLAAVAADDASGPAGEALYGRHCALCHVAGDGHPGTMRLAARLDDGRSVLLDRDDLTPDYVALVIRAGLQMMPPFRPTEITDAEVARLAAWVADGGTQGTEP